MPNPPLPNTLATSIRTLLASDAADESTAQRAAAAARVCEELSEHLARVVGRSGIRALFDRSAVLTQAEFPWMAGAVTRSPEPPWARLCDCFAQQSPDVALECAVALVTTFVGLLSRFIGDELVVRLLHEVWPDVFLPLERPSADADKESM